MASTNHIIIPIVGSRQSLQKQNIFVPSALVLTPSKEQPCPQAAFWKKSMSAFRKFKDRKDRKDKKHSPDHSLENQPLGHPRPLFRLTTKTQTLANTQLAVLAESCLNYFDPNAAPLYDWNHPDDGPPEPRPFKMVQEYHQIKLEKIQSSPNQEPPLPEPPEHRDDDPFIIIRKDRKNKHKTKVIRKDKPPSAIEEDRIKDRREPQAGWSSQEDSPVKGRKKAIYTLQELMEAATMRHRSDEIVKLEGNFLSKGSQDHAKPSE